MNASPGDLLIVARRAADAAAERLLHHFDAGCEVRTKADGSPVTVADEEAEAIIRRILLEAFPDHGFYGEEGGASGLDRPVLWLVDPLDGTRSFVAGTPFFSTQIAAMVEGQLAVGVSVAPAWGERAWAVAGGPALLDGRQIEVSTVDCVEEASVSTGNIGSLAADGRRWQGLGGVLSRAARTRGYGDFCHYHLLAAGRLDAVIESDVNILDIAALAVIVGAAGGVMTDLDGGEVGLETRSVLAANPTLHPLLEAALRA